MFVKKCAWCGIVLRKYEDGRRKKTVSHGICKRCKRKVLEREEAAKVETEQIAPETRPELDRSFREYARGLHGKTVR